MRSQRGDRLIIVILVQGNGYKNRTTCQTEWFIRADDAVELQAPAGVGRPSIFLGPGLAGF